MKYDSLKINHFIFINDIFNEKSYNKFTKETMKFFVNFSPKTDFNISKKLHNKIFDLLKDYSRNEIKPEEIKISDQKKYEEQVNSLLDELVPKRDNDFNNKLKKKLNLAFQAFFCEVNSPENEIQNSISNFFLRISLFLSNQTMGTISEKTANMLLRELMKINSIEEEINEILKFVNKK